MFSELWLVPVKKGPRVPTTFRNPKKDVVRALNLATPGSHQGRSLRVYEEDLSSIECEVNILCIRFVAEGQDTPLGRLLNWSTLRRPVKLPAECRLQPAVFPRYEEMLKVILILIINSLLDFHFYSSLAHPSRIL